MDQTPAIMDRHFDVIQCHQDGGVLLGASSLTGRYWFGSLWYCDDSENILHVEKCTAGVQLEAGLGDALWLDDSKILVGLDTGGVAIWELTENFHTFLHVQSAVEHDNMVTSVSVSANRNKAVSGSLDRSIKVWDVETMCSSNTYRGHYDSVQCVKYHPSDPALFLSCSQDGRTWLWDTRLAKPVTVLGGFIPSPYPVSVEDTYHLQQSPTYVTWRPGSQQNYAVADEAGQVVVKDTRNMQGSPISFCPHTRAVKKLAFDPNRPTLLASVSEDCTAVVTAVGSDTAKQILCDKSHQDFVQDASWSKDGRLLTCAWDSKVYTHKVEYSPGSVDFNDSASTSMETNSKKDKVSTKEIRQVNCDTNGVQNGEMVN